MKEQSKHWIIKQDEDGKVGWLGYVYGFCDALGIILIKYLEKGKTINGLYSALLLCLMM